MGRQTKRDEAGEPLEAEAPEAACARLAGAGDFAAVFDVISTTPSAFFDLRAALRQLRRAVDLAAKADPAAFADGVFRSATAFTTYALLRLQQAAAQALAADDGRDPTRGLPPRFLELLPLLGQLQAQMVQLLQAQAATARLWTLARRKEATRPEPPPARRGRRGPGGLSGSLN